MYNSYIVRRTQIYLSDEQERALRARATATSRTKSSVIRDAIDAYLASAVTSESELDRFRMALNEAAGIAPHLPSGDDYVRELRSGDRRRERALEERRASPPES
jgi:predicted DNA-binding protein